MVVFARLLGLIGLLILLPAGAAPAAAPASLSSWEGVYKTRFDNALVSGERYRSENILEIAGYSKDAAYIRLALEFYNGHQCALSGIADQAGATLVYRAIGSVGEKPCVLTLRRAGGKVVLADRDGVCTLSGCGARGSFEGVSFPLEARRPIRYLPRLKASSQYKAAVEAYRARPRAPG